MRQSALFLFSTLLFIFASISPADAKSDIADVLVHFFRPVSATIIMSVDGTGFLIDKGTENGIRQGDYLTVVRKETPLYHPRSGERLDTVEEYGESLVVTKAKPRMSYAKSTVGKPSLKEGVRVDRFAHIPVYFTDSSAEGFQLFSVLRERLPHLQWKGYLTDGKSPVFDREIGLVIRHAGGQTRVITQDGRILFMKNMAETAPAKSRPNGDSTAAPNRRENRSLSGRASLSRGREPMAKWVVCRIEIPQPGEIEALRVTDIDQDGKPEILLGIQGTVFVYRLEGQKLSEVTQMAVAQWQQIINISTLDINSDGQEEIIVSARFDNRGETRIFNFQDSEFREMARTSMLLARFEPIDRAPFLLGIDAHEFLMRDPQFYRVELKKKKLRKEAYPLPGADQPYGNASLAKKGGGIWLASLKADNHLVVRDARARLRWESGENYGGSIRGLKVFLQGKRNLDDFEMHYFHSRLKKTSRGTLLVSQHDGPGLFKNSPNYKKGRIVELSWNGATFDEVAETPNLGGFVVDFDQYDLGHDNTDDIFAGLQYRQGGFFREPISGLVILSPH